MIDNALDFEGLKYYDGKNKDYIQEQIKELIDSLPDSIREYSHKAIPAPTTALDELTGAGIWYEYNKVCTGVPTELENTTVIALIKNETVLNVTIQTLTTISNGVISSWQRRYSSTGGWGNWYKCINSNDMSKLKTMHLGISTLGVITDSTTTLAEVINLLDDVSEVTFYTTSSRYPGIYTEVLAGIQTAYPNITSLGAHVTIRKNGTTSYITVEDYNEPSNKFETIYKGDVADNWVKYVTTSDTESRRMYMYPSNFGCSSSDTTLTLQKMIEAMDEKSHVNFWINNSNSYASIYNEVLAGIKERYSNVTEIYGNVDIVKTDGTAYVTAHDYRNPNNIFMANYTTINSIGWSEWVKISTGTDLEEIGTYTSTPNAEVGYNDNIVVGATICMQKLSKTRCNLYISYKIWTNNETNSNIFYFMSGEKIRNALGLKTLTAVASQSQVTFTPSFDVDSNGNLTVVSAETALGVMGHTGIKAVIDATGLQIGRIYNDTGSYGSWPVGTFSDSLFKVNTYGQINFYGASYSI